MERLKAADNKEIEEVECSEKFLKMKEERNEIRLNLIKQSTEINKLKQDLDDVEEKLKKAVKSCKGEELEKLKHENVKLAKSIDEKGSTLKRVRGERERALDRIEVMKKQISELEDSKEVIEEDLREKTEAWLNKKSELENQITG
jgi:predicted  nucleic acid-binding Zn-ribbon protein